MGNLLNSQSVSELMFISECYRTVEDYEDPRDRIVKASLQTFFLERTSITQYESELYQLAIANNEEERRASLARIAALSPEQQPRLCLNFLDIPLQSRALPPDAAWSVSVVSTSPFWYLTLVV